MRAFPWILWLGFVAATCGVVVATMGSERGVPAQPTQAPGVLPAAMCALFIAFSLYARFRVIPRLIASSALVHPSPRLSAALASCWFLCLFSIGGAAPALAAQGSSDLATLLGLGALVAIVVEAPWFRERPGGPTDVARNP